LLFRLQYDWDKQDFIGQLLRVKLPTLKIFFRNFVKFAQTVFFYAKTILRNLGAHDLFFYASALSFQVVLCLVPTLFLIIWLLGIFLSRAALLNQLEIIIRHVLPSGLNIAEETRNFFMNRARVFTGHQRIFGFVGIAGFLWTSLTLMGTLRKTVFHVLDVESNRSSLRQTVYDLRVLLIAGFFLTASTIVTTIFAGLREAAMQLPAGQMRFTLIRFCVPILFALVLTFFLYFSIYRFFSYGKIKSSTAAFGAFWAAVLYELAKNIFALYIARVGNLWQMYGALEMTIGMLLWIFYSTCVFIFGVELCNANSMKRMLASTL
jgi:membrane protein